MRNLLRASLALLAVAGVFLALTAYRHARATAQKTQTVFVNFRGPWAFARDPNDANSVFAFAPKTKTHHDLVVQSSESKSSEDKSGESKTLAAGVYELALPAVRSSTPKGKDPRRLRVSPAASTEKDYVTGVSLRYSVDKLSGFSLAGKPDDASPFNRLPVDSPVISFVIDPLPGQMMMECSMHVREAFRDLAKLVNLKMFVDFPSDPSACRDHDPQKPPA